MVVMERSRLALLLLLAAGFGLSSTWWLHQSPAPGAVKIGSVRGATPGDAAPGVSIGKGALWAIRLDDAAGHPHALAEWAGRPLLINFWATWCEPCREEMPLLSAAAARPELGGASVVGIALDDPKAVRDYLRARALGFPVLLDGKDVGQNLAARLGDPEGALPFSALVDRDGVVVEIRLGPWKPGEIEARLAELLHS